MVIFRYLISVFLSTLPARGATGPTAWARRKLKISIHAPREGSDGRGLQLRRGPDGISIHAPREGSDTKPIRHADLRQHFYPRSPRGERHLTIDRVSNNGKFLSTLPARGATRSGTPAQGWRFHFYPRSPRGERRSNVTGNNTQMDFYPRSPRGERQFAGYAYMVGYKISIHAPREGSDYVLVCHVDVRRNFYPRSPRGERRIHSVVSFLK